MLKGEDNPPKVGANPSAHFKDLGARGDRYGDTEGTSTSWSGSSLARLVGSPLEALTGSTTFVYIHLNIRYDVLSIRYG